MKKIKQVLFFLLLLAPSALLAKITDPAKELVCRVTEKHNFPISLSVKSDLGKRYFSHKVKNGVLYIEGSDNVSLCRGFYDYVKSNHYGLYSWSGNNIQLPEKLENAPLIKKVTPFANYYYFNVVTYGYTMPYWDWSRWEKEIDFMALHGINMPLALVANEAITARVFAKIGLTEEEIRNYFVGPAHLPWMRMGNISGVDGPLSDAWHKDQIALQHKILKRMKELGMKPVCPAFAGFVPKEIKRLYPDVKLTETLWADYFHNWMLSPQDDLFQKIGKLFIQEWEKEFGKNDYYIADSFNEMDIPFPPKDDPKRYSLLASYGDRVYQSIKAGNKDAVWVMQGWMFGHMRDVWDYKTLNALVSKVPNDKMLLLDLAVDYNKHWWKNGVNYEFYKGFFGKPWIYSVIPNMGGKNGLTGILEFYANGHLDALNSVNKGNLQGFGMAPEGLENNEVIYELLGDAGWSDKKIDLNQWLKDYSLCRYGSYPKELEYCWSQMLESVYGTFNDHPRYNWQFRPGAVPFGSINTNEAFFEGIEKLATVSGSILKSELFAYDLAQWTGAYVGGKLEILVNKIEKAYAVKDLALAEKLEARFESLMLRLDALLSTYPTSNLQEWINKAKSKAQSANEVKEYECNARRIVTVWGPPIDDYSARIWGGLLRDYYLNRWKHYFNEKKTGVRFDFAKWELDWVENQVGLSKVPVLDNPVEEAVSLIKAASDI